MVVAGHPLAAQAGFQEAGGNAIDAGVAVGLAINVLESEMTCFAGVAPSMIRMGATGVVQNFVGVGPWPRALDAEYFHKHQGGLVPEGILNTVVPGSPESRTRGRRGGRSNTCPTRPRDTMLAGPEMARRVGVHHSRQPIEWHPARRRRSPAHGLCGRLVIFPSATFHLRTRGSYVLRQH